VIGMVPEDLRPKRTPLAITSSASVDVATSEPPPPTVVSAPDVSLEKKGAKFAAHAAFSSFIFGIAAENKSTNRKTTENVGGTGFGVGISYFAKERVSAGLSIEQGQVNDVKIEDSGASGTPINATGQYRVFSAVVAYHWFFDNWSWLAGGGIRSAQGKYEFKDPLFARGANTQEDFEVTTAIVRGGFDYAITSGLYIGMLVEPGIFFNGLTGSRAKRYKDNGIDKVNAFSSSVQGTIGTRF
jgi:hypothetical protein